MLRRKQSPFKTVSELRTMFMLHGHRMIKTIYTKIHFFKALVFLLEYQQSMTLCKSSVKSQKGAINIQTCSIENQKGAMDVQSL